MNETKKQHASLIRRGDFAISELSESAKKLEELAAQLRALVTEAEKAKMKSLRIDGITKLPRGLDLIRDFAANVNQSLFKAKFK